VIGNYAWPAPAKINLFLHITGRRQDGYHELQTVFQFLDYGDELFFRIREDSQIRLLSPLPGVDPEEDLTLRAARRLQAGSAVPWGVDIDLRKRIPMGAGLGGGSSDAATALVALNHLWGLNLSPQELSGIAIELGADVPIFIFGRAAWAEGVGERLHPIEPEEPWYLVVVPNCRVLTAEVFNACELTRNAPPSKIPDFVIGFGRNDCEALVRKRYPEVGEALDWLGSDGRLTGTGSCVFRPFQSAAKAYAKLADLPRRWRGFVTRGCNRSPLLSRLGGTC
jgi:4-diphosphocytidyl-2-C-methyl-D-erythritol kinase